MTNRRPVVGDKARDHRWLAYHVCQNAPRTILQRFLEMGNLRGQESSCMAASVHLRRSPFADYNDTYLPYWTGRARICQTAQT
jgi:hypothetical protein